MTSWQDLFMLRVSLSFRPYAPLSTTCLVCGNAAHIAYHTQRTITTLTGRHRLHLAVRRCISPECSRYHRPYRPEGAWALPHGEYGLDVIALVGTLRYQRHQSLTEIHHRLHERGLSIGERTVLNLLARMAFIAFGFSNGSTQAGAVVFRNFVFTPLP